MLPTCSTTRRRTVERRPTRLCFSALLSELNASRTSVQSTTTTVRTFLSAHSRLRIPHQRREVAFLNLVNPVSLVLDADRVPSTSQDSTASSRRRDRTSTDAAAVSRRPRPATPATDLLVSLFTPSPFHRESCPNTPRTSVAAKKSTGLMKFPSQTTSRASFARW